MRYVCFILLLIFTCNISCASNGEIDKKQIVLATSDWGPLIGRDLEEGGYLPAIIKAALNRSGYSLRIKWVSWDRAIEMGKRGHFDGVIAAGQIQESPLFFNLSDSSISENYGYFTLKYPRINQNPLSQIHLPVVGAIKTSSIIEELYKNKNIDIKEEYHQYQNIKNLLDGNINAFVGGARHIQDLLKNRFSRYQNQIVMVKSIKMLRHHHIMISKKHPHSSQIINDFNQGLRQIQESGEIDEIRLKYGFDESFLQLNGLPLVE